MTTPNDTGFQMSDASSSVPQGRQIKFPSSSSSARPRGPPSENLGVASDDEGDAFADDHVPRSSRHVNTASIPRVEDRVGLLVQEHFQSFIER